MKTTLKEVSNEMYSQVSGSNPNPTTKVFKPVVALGYGSNVEIIDECYTSPQEAENRSKELVSDRYTLRSCGFSAQVSGYCSQRIDQDGEVPQSTSGIKYTI